MASFRKFNPVRSPHRGWLLPPVFCLSLSLCLHSIEAALYPVTIAQIAVFVTKDSGQFILLWHCQSIQFDLSPVLLGFLRYFHSGHQFRYFFIELLEQAM